MARNLTYEGLLEKVNSFDEYGAYVVKHLDEALWLQTIRINTKEAYENYLKIFPKGLYLRGANYRIDNFMVQEKQDKDKIERASRLQKEKELQHQKKIEEQENRAKEERLKQEKIREEKLKQEAIERDHHSFKTAQKFNNELSYSDYLKNYPYGLHKAEALRKIDEFVRIKQEKAKEEKRIQELGKKGIVIINGLMWEKDTKTMNWYNAMKYAENLRRGGYSDWRLPTKEELEDVVRSCGGISIGYDDKNWSAIGLKNRGNIQYQNFIMDKGFFKDNSYWSSTLLSGETNYVYVMGFSSGYVYSNNISNSNRNYFRCVRAEQ